MSHANKAAQNVVLSERGIGPVSVLASSAPAELPDARQLEPASAVSTPGAQRENQFRSGSNCGFPVAVVPS